MVNLSQKPFHLSFSLLSSILPCSDSPMGRLSLFLYTRVLRPLDSPDLRGQLGLDSTDLSDKSASRSSQVSSDFSIFDFTSGKNVEDSRAPLRRLKSSFIRPATSHGHTHGGYSTLSFEPKQFHPTSVVSPIDAIVMPTSEVQTLQPSLGTPLTQQTKPSLLSRPPTVRRRRNLIFIQPGDDDSANECQAPYSRSPSNTSILRLPRPKTTPNLPTTRDSSSQAMRQHFVEVKRMRKMTQVIEFVLGRRSPF